MTTTRKMVLALKEDGYTVKEISEELEMKVTTVHKYLDFNDKRDLDNKAESTITDFREHGCAVARCKKCGKPMYDIAEDNEGGYHYSCGSCGWSDWKDTACADRCCRRGFALLLEKESEVEVDKDELEAWVEEG